jgi:hypothetical protein
MNNVCSVCTGPPLQRLSPTGYREQRLADITEWSGGAAD